MSFCSLQEHPSAPAVSDCIPATEHDRRAGDEDSAAFSCSRNKKDPAMGLFSKDIKTMNDLFVHQLRDIYYAEKQLVKALPKMAERPPTSSSSRAF